MLQLGEGFSAPTEENKKDKIVVEFIKQVQHNIGRTASAIQIDVMNRAIPIIKKFYTSSLKQNNIDNILS